MNKWIKMLCFVLAALIALSLCGCGEEKDEQPDNAGSKESYIGTWKGSDHDGENVVHYLIFDANGYWKVYMNRTTLTRAVKQLPDQLVSFKIFCKLQKSGQTGCYYEYIADEDGNNYTDCFTVSDEGQLTENVKTDVLYTKISTNAGEPDETIINEARDLFDRAREAALS